MSPLILGRGVHKNSGVHVMPCGLHYGRCQTSQMQWELREDTQYRLYVHGAPERPAWDRFYQCHPLNAVLTPKRRG